ncbi:MAG: glycoside hydrolase family 38 C-terminal domain-containing protein, partial [Terrimesophilobacter sp.]
YSNTTPLVISAWEVPGEPVEFSVARQATFTPFAEGTRWGKPWGTVWFHVTGAVPVEWHAADAKIEVVVDLGFRPGIPGFQAEGLAFTPDGQIIKAVEPFNDYVPVASGSTVVDFYLEAASNPDVAAGFLFKPTALGDLATAGDELLYRLNRLELARLDTPVWELVQDVRALRGLMAELPDALPRRHLVLSALGTMVDVMDPTDISGTALAGRAALAEALASPAYASSHRLAAVGNAHIDSAWLWPVRETVRKVARTFSNVVALMDEDPDFSFAASSAQQFEWLKAHQPELFERIRVQVAAGRFIPVGGMWVECDTNMPGGEALARQFIAGKRFFMEEFGIEPVEAWLPDSFGYSAALPQIVVAAGSKWFLTQKISWNETNTMPHHTFWWEGIDGTRVFTHFPPVDTYAAEVTAKELARAERQYAEKGVGTISLLPFGWGDGGGGPTREMLAAVARTGDLEGSPRTFHTTPEKFFTAAHAEYPDAPVWSGELYLELHRGTLTSQAETKRGNRRSEHLLREAELWASAATVLRGAPYPYEELEAVWKIVLLQQFHDILPGSAIAWVHQEAERNYERVAADLDLITAGALAVLAGDGEDEVVFNAGPLLRNGVDGISGAVRTSVQRGAEPTAHGGGFILANDHTRVTIDARGLVVSMIDLHADRELIPEGQPGNLLQLFRDTPNQWDAWDVDESYRRDRMDLTEVSRLAISDSGDTLLIDRSFGSSTVSQKLRLNAETGALDITVLVDWHETQKLLKLAFPLDIHAERAASEIQFGHVFRATHTNTSWDAARFETVAHRWVHVGEPGYGVAIANDASYGYDIRRVGEGGKATSTVVRASLLRAPLFPDPHSDQGTHEFSFSLRIGAGIAEAVEEGYRLNIPERTVRGGSGVPALFTNSTPAVIIETIKLAEDRSGDVVIRMYESLGSRTRTTITPGFEWGSVAQTDLLERAVEPTAVLSDTEGSVALTLRPFQLVTLRFTRS